MSYSPFSYFSFPEQLDYTLGSKSVGTHFPGHISADSTLDGHIPAGHTPAGLLDGHTPASHTLAGHIPDGHTPDGHTPDGHTPDGHTANSHALTGDGQHTAASYTDADHIISAIKGKKKISY